MSSSTRNETSAGTAGSDVEVVGEIEKEPRDYVEILRRINASLTGKGIKDLFANGSKKKKVFTSIMYLDSVKDWIVEVVRKDPYDTIDFDDIKMILDVDVTFGTEVSRGLFWDIVDHCLRDRFSPETVPLLDHEEGLNLLAKLNQLLKSIVESPLVVRYWENCIMVIYVDDIIIIGAKKSDLDQATSVLSHSFHMKNLKEPKIFLGMTLECKSGRIKLSAKDTIERILGNLDIDLPRKPLGTPIPLSYDLIGEDTPLLDSTRHSEYRSVVGMLLYISNTVRFDIAYHVSVLASYVNAPREIHYKAAERVLEYLGQTKSAGIVYRKHGRMSYDREDFQFIDATGDATIKVYPPETEYVVTGYTDADWGKAGDGKSQSGGLIALRGNLISWLSRKQSVVAQSSAESELISANEVACHLCFFSELLNEMKRPVEYANLCADNRSALTLSNHSGMNNKTRHIKLRYFHIQDLVAKKELRLWYISGEVNPADIMTKRLAPKKFRSMTAKLLELN